MPEMPPTGTPPRRRLRWLYARAVFLPTLAWNLLLGRVLRVRRWWDRVDEHVIVGALPLARDVSRLSALGVTGVVNTCDEYAGPQRDYDRAKIEQLRVRTVDFTAPSPAHVREAVEFIEGHAARGGTVYVHCKAGRGRSATIAMCWLIKSAEMTPDEAQRHLLKVRPHVHKSLHRRPVVQDFFAKYRQLFDRRSTNLS